MERGKSKIRALHAGAGGLLALGVLAVLACSKAPDAKNTSPVASTGPGAAETATAAATTPTVPTATGQPTADTAAAPVARAETPAYVAELRSPGSPAAGAATKLRVVVTPKDGWHFNLKFPTSMSMAGAGVTVDRPSQKLKDAVASSEAEGAAWEATVTCGPGARTITANLSFAVCTETTCDPKKAELAWNVDVKQ
jgi:hypothetical protein